MARQPSTQRPLSAAQYGVWLAAQLDPDNPLFSIAHYVEIHAALDVDAFTSACRSVTSACEAINQRIVAGPDGPGQVHENLGHELALVDLTAASDPMGEAQRWIDEDLGRPVDIHGDELFAHALLRVGAEHYLWYVRCHHVVMDAFGGALLMREVARAHSSLAAGRSAEPVAFAALDVLIDTDTEYRRSLAYKEDAEFWIGRLRELPDRMSVRPGPGTPHRLLRASAGIGSWSGLIAVARELRVAWPVLVTALAAAFLQRRIGTTEVVLGLETTGRTQPGTRDVPGMTSNISPLRLTAPGRATLAELARDTAAAMREALRHQRYRGEEIRRDLGLGDGRQPYGPIVNVMPFDHDLVFGTAPGVVHRLSSGPVDDLALLVYPESGGDLRVDIDANPDRYPQATVDALLADFVRLVEAACHSTVDVCLRDLPMLGEAELCALAGCNATEADFGPAACLHELFETQVHRTPHAPAVRAGDATLTYAELDAAANRVANALVRRDVGADTPVGVWLDRSLDLLVALLGTLKAGGAYVPIDPEVPAERARQLLTDAGAPVCLTQPDLARRYGDDETLLLLDDAAHAPSSHPAVPVHPENLVSIYYTSGSTGRPKGVANTHAGWVNRMRWMQAQHGLRAGEAVLHKTVLSFDDSAVELFWPLTVGATVVMLEPELHRDPAALLRAVAGQSIAVVQFVPSMLELFLQAITAAEVPALASLRHVISSGEVLRPDLVERFLDRLDRLECRLHNQWGPTEASIDATLHTCGPADARDTVPIGAPLSNYRAYVLDPELRRSPVGTPGELYVAGVGLARGYWGDSAKTAAAFIADPYGTAGERMYRTGDLAVRREDGELLFLGRVDHQLKIRGIRVEPAEIEHVLREHGAVADALVMKWEPVPGDARLAAYLVLHDPTRELPTEDIRAHAARLLPPYLVPAAFVALAELPLLASGKVNRHALPAPTHYAAAIGRPPATPLEEVLCSVFSDVLGLPQVGADGDFFDLGGHSLLVSRLVSRLRTVLGVELPIRAVFDHPTVAGLATLVGTAAAARPAARPMPRPERVPLSFAQQRLWFLNRLQGTGYQIPVAVELRGPLDVAALEAALGDVVDRHESLRTVFTEVDGVAYQRVLGPGTVALPWTERVVAPEEVEGAIAELAGRGFDLEA
jgi:amino acid adenylation domain-containing protein